jgi:outer membrane protein
MITRTVAQTCLLILTAGSALFAQGAAQHITLSDAETTALGYSGTYLAAVAEARSAEQYANSLNAPLYPRLSFDANYRYNSVVPVLTPAFPGALPQRLGDNANWSVGPTLTYTLWEDNASLNTLKAAEAIAQARTFSRDNVHRQTLLSVRTAYFQVALAAEQVTITSDAVVLAQSQYNDIRTRARGGTASRYDELSAHTELLNRQKQLYQAQGEWSVALRSLSALTGTVYCVEPCTAKDALPAETEPVVDTTTVTATSLDPLNELLARFMPYYTAVLTAQHPAVRSYEQLSTASRFSAQSAAAGYWPRIQLSARTSLDYPNGPALEQINQNSFSAVLAWPLFEAGAPGYRAAQNRAQSEAYLQQRQQIFVNLQRDHAAARDRLAALMEQRTLNNIIVGETKEVAAIAYAAYRAGGRTWVDVENANYRYMSARSEQARTVANMLINLAILAGMAE